jgi:hypothetical protein
MSREVFMCEGTVKWGEVSDRVEGVGYFKRVSMLAVSPGVSYRLSRYFHLFSYSQFNCKSVVKFFFILAK